MRICAMGDHEPHSQLYFTDARDHWWNDDFVALLAKRLGLGSARRVLDVGAGQGHFARLWAPHLAPDFEVVCVDPEARSLKVAEEKCAAFLARTGLKGRFVFTSGRAESLPFDDCGFDAAICQTLLIHLRDPGRALDEMTRVVRHGGLVLASEPNNLGELQRLAARGPEADPEEVVRALRFDALCMRGKYRLGLGWNNVGAHLPRWFARLADVRYFQNDRPWVMAAPYDGVAQRAALADLRSMHARGIFHWGRDDARAYYAAGGGDPARFDDEYDAGLTQQAE
ncbi:MAG: methyltransferase domain-containing protein, partial [Deltaproteobacteria bacterium]